MGVNCSIRNGDITYRKAPYILYVADLFERRSLATRQMAGA